MNRSKEANRLYFGMLVFIISMALLFNRVLKIHVGAFASVTLTEVLVLLPVIIYLLIGHGSVLDGIGIRIPNIKEILWCGLLALLIEPAVLVLNLLSQLFVDNYVAGSLTSTQEESLFFNLFFYALLPAVVEEFIFRGVLRSCYRPAGLLKSSLVTGLLFGLSHLNFNQFPYAFLLGIFLALLMEVSGNLILPILVHFLMNGSSVITAHLLSVSEDASAAKEIAADQAADSSFSPVFWIRLIFIALVSLALALRVLKQLAVLSGRGEMFKNAFIAEKGSETKQPLSTLRVSDIYLVASVLIAIGYMAYQNARM